MDFSEQNFIKLLEENKRLKNENNELKDKLNREAHYCLDKTNEMIRNEISEHIRKHLNFDLDQINEIIRNEISQHLKAQVFTDSNEQNDIKNIIKQNISNHNLNKNMLFDIKLTNQDKNIKKENAKNDIINNKTDNNKTDNNKTDNNKTDNIKPICDLKQINDIIKEEKMDICVISHGGCCSNQLVDILTENGYNIRTPIWDNILCHCPEYIDIDIPIIYIYGNPLYSFLSVKKRGEGFWDINQKKLSNNENITLSDENLLKLMLKQINAWINIKKDNVLILKSSEIFEEPILDKLQSFLKKDLHSFPITYIKPKTSLENLDRDELMLFQKYKKNINTIIKKYLYDL
jgi:hypothetical protein